MRQLSTRCSALLRPVVVGLAITLALGACSDDEEPEASQPALGFDESPQDVAAAGQAQLTLDDLEGEWDVEEGEQGALQGLFDLTEECADMAPALSTSAPSRTAEPGIRRFTSNDGEVITSGVTTYKDEAAAIEFMDGLRGR